MYFFYNFSDSRSTGANRTTSTLTLTGMCARTGWRSRFTVSVNVSAGREGIGGGGDETIWSQPHKIGFILLGIVQLLVSCQHENIG